MKCSSLQGNSYMSQSELGQGDEVLPPLTEQEGDGQNGS